MTKKFMEEDTAHRKTVTSFNIPKNSTACKKLDSNLQFSGVGITCPTKPIYGTWFH